MRFRFNQDKFGAVCVGLIAFLLFLSCDNHIIQRAASDYFLYEEGNWWQLAAESDTMIVEVEPLDTLQTECYPVSYGGYVKYLIKRSDAVAQYVKIVHNSAGDDYTIIEDFIVRIELPLIENNAWIDSLVDSVHVAGEWVSAKYYVNGRIAGFEHNDDFDGDVYTVEIENIEIIRRPDTTIIDTTYVVEDYAPNIGLVRLQNNLGEYNLIDYDIQ